MSFTQDRDERARIDARNHYGNLFTGTLALLRPRYLRILGLAKDWKNKDKIGMAVLELVAILKSRVRLNRSVRDQVGFLYPDFIPSKHYAKIEYDEHGQVESFEPIPEHKLAKLGEKTNEDFVAKFRYPRMAYHLCFVHIAKCEEVMAICNVFADGIYELTGAALIKKMEDFTKGMNAHIIDEEFADDLQRSYS